MTTLDELLKKSKDLNMYYKKSNTDIKIMIKNVFNASFRFGLNDTQTIYMIEQALKPFKNELLIDMLGGNYE